jgi:hypothetical protein
MHLSNAAPVTRDVSSLVGAYNGNLAVSSARVFVSGEHGTVSFPKNDLQSSSYSTVHANYSLVTNLANQQVYALGDSNADFLVSSGDLDCLIPIHATTGLRDPALRILWLTETIPMGTGSVVASGHNSVGIVEKTTLDVYRINLRNGRVTEIGKSMDRWILPTPWLQSAVMEFSFEETHKLSYSEASGSLERQELTGSSVIDAPFTATLGTAASICTDYLSHKWYYFYSGNGTFGQGEALLGSATMDALEMNPTSRPSSQPSSRPSILPSAQPSSQPSVRPFSHPTGQPTQQPTTRPSGLEVGMDTFEVLTLSSQNPSTVNVTGLIGTFDGSLGVSPTHVFVSGSRGTIGLSKGSLDSENPVVVTAKSSMITNMANQRIFALGDADSNFIDGAGLLYCLIPLDPATGSRNYFGRILWLSEPVPVTYGAGLYSGHNRLVVTDSTSLDSYEINLENGNVVQVEDEIRRSQTPVGALTFGIVEYTFQNALSINYAAPEGGVESQLLDNQHLLGAAFNGDLGYASSLTVDASTSRWYFCYAGDGTFGEGSAVLGYADVVILESAPTSSPSSQPSSVPSVAGLVPEVFDILDFRSTNAEERDVTTLLGDFQNNLAVSETRVFAKGTKGTFGLPKDTLAVQDAVFVPDNYTAVTNMDTQQMFALGDTLGAYLVGTGEIG